MLPTLTTTTSAAGKIEWAGGALLCQFCELHHSVDEYGRVEVVVQLGAVTGPSAVVAAFAADFGDVTRQCEAAITLAETNCSWMITLGRVTLTSCGPWCEAGGIAVMEHVRLISFAAPRAQQTPAIPPAYTQRRPRLRHQPGIAASGSIPSAAQSAT
jgi:hypothetical protein